MLFGNCGHMVNIYFSALGDDNICQLELICESSLYLEYMAFNLHFYIHCNAADKNMVSYSFYLFLLIYISTFIAISCYYVYIICTRQYIVSI